MCDSVASKDDRQVMGHVFPVPLEQHETSKGSKMSVGKDGDLLGGEGLCRLMSLGRRRKALSLPSGL